MMKILALFAVVAATWLTVHGEISQISQCFIELPVREDGRCGPSFPLTDGSPGQCDPDSSSPCCSPIGWCGNTAAHCDCAGCIDFRPCTGPNQLEIFPTPAAFNYNYLASSSPITRVDFRVQAPSDVLIVLSSGPQYTANIYEIVIGAAANALSIIRLFQGANQIVASTPGYLSPTELRGFWITYNNGVIKVGRKYNAAFMEWTDPNPTQPINYIGYSTTSASTGEFEFCVPSPTECMNVEERHSDTSVNYYYPPLSSPPPLTYVEFKVKTTKDFRIGLTSGPQNEPDMYEIILSGWGNTQSVIRRQRNGANKVLRYTPSYVSPNEFRGFWVSYDGSTVKIGKAFHEAFMQWTDPVPLTVNNVGYTSGDGKVADYQICLD